MFKKVRRYLRDPYYSFGKLFLEKYPNLMPDKWFLKIIYKAYMGKELNLQDPKNYNEKLNWLKLYDRKPLYTTLVDKLAVKDYVAQKIGSEYIIPTLKVYDSAGQIILEDLPEQFVLKCNHDSGSFVICKDKETFDFEAAKQKLTACLKQDFYLLAREWPYKNVPRKIIAEQYIKDDTGEALIDYKWFCFNGEPKIMYIGRDKGEHPSTDFFDMEFNHLPIQILDPPSEVCPDKPVQFDEMKRIASILSKDIPHVRVDFYVINNHIYFGEFTFFHLGGFSNFNDENWNELLGSWINLELK